MSKYRNIPRHNIAPMYSNTGRTHNAIVMKHMMKPDALCSGGLGGLVHQLAEVSGTGIRRFYDETGMYGDWFVDFPGSTDKMTMFSIDAILLAISWCRGHTEERIFGVSMPSRLIGAEVLRRRNGYGLTLAYIQFNFEPPEGSTEDNTQVIMTPDHILRLIPLWSLVREAIANSALLGTSRISGYNSSIRRFVRHPLYERYLWWRIFQFLGLARVK